EDSLDTHRAYPARAGYVRRRRRRLPDAAARPPLLTACAAAARSSQTRLPGSLVRVRREGSPAAEERRALRKDPDADSCSLPLDIATAVELASSVQLCDSVE